MLHMVCDDERWRLVQMKKPSGKRSGCVTVVSSPKPLGKDPVTGAEIFQGPGMPVVPHPDLDDIVRRNRDSTGRIGLRGGKGAELTKHG